MAMHDRWNGWLEVLRPDRLTRERLRRAVFREARPILAGRRASWFDAVSDWATVLSPVAAAVTLVFAGLALQQASKPADVGEPTRLPPAAEDLVIPSEGFPDAFAEDSVPDLDVVMTVIYEPLEP